jgi:hypothetical protein
VNRAQRKRPVPPAAAAAPPRTLLRARSKSVDSGLRDLGNSSSVTKALSKPRPSQHVNALGDSFPQPPPEYSVESITRFFDEHVLSQCSPGSNKAFLDHLPTLYNEVNIGGRYALRYAVQAAALANDLQGESVSDGGPVAWKSLDFYGKALSALSTSLSEKKESPPDDYDLMTVALLDLFEVSVCGSMSGCQLNTQQTLHLPESSTRGSHAEGLAHILRIRGHQQFYDPRGWALFRMAHHRLVSHHFLADLCERIQSYAKPNSKRSISQLDYIQ